MTEVDPLLQLTAIIQDVGIWAVFLYLFINERAAHNVTRMAHMEDLREIAGMRPPLGRVNENPDK